MEFASEIVVKATLFNFRISEVPVTLSPDGRSRPPHLRSWRDGWRHLRFLLLYSPRWLFLYPGALLMAIGLATAAWLLPGPRTIGSVTFDVHSLLYSAGAIVIGFQSVTFAVFAKIFAITEGLVPADRQLDRLFRFVDLEKGLIVGGVLMVLSVMASVYALNDWGARFFGPLDVSRTFRVVIPAVLALILGFQITLSSFFSASSGWAEVKCDGPVERTRMTFVDRMLQKWRIASPALRVSRGSRARPWLRRWSPLPATPVDGGRSGGH
jgi:hypothetical protein